MEVRTEFCLLELEEGVALVITPPILLLLGLIGSGIAIGWLHWVRIFLITFDCLLMRLYDNDWLETCLGHQFTIALFVLWSPSFCVLILSWRRIKQLRLLLRLCSMLMKFKC